MFIQSNDIQEILINITYITSFTSDIRRHRLSPFISLSPPPITFLVVDKILSVGYLLS